MHICPTCSTPHNRNHASCAECHAAYMREWRKTHKLTPEQKVRDNARSYAYVYLKRGLLTREPCRDCGIEHDPPLTVVQMHHSDYTKPLDVTWLCTDCHQDHHNEESSAG